MSIRTRLESAAELSATERFRAAAVEICRFGRNALVHVIRVRRDRAWLADLPDYLLRDIGITRSQISSVTRLGRTDGYGLGL